MPEGDRVPEAGGIGEARRAGRAYGVGVIAVSDPTDWDTWNELEEARGVEPGKITLRRPAVARFPYCCVICALTMTPSCTVYVPL